MTSFHIVRARRASNAIELLLLVAFAAICLAQHKAAVASRHGRAALEHALGERDRLREQLDGALEHIHDTRPAGGGETSPAA